MLTAILGATFFYEYVSLAGWVAILACVLGVVTISLSRADSHYHGLGLDSGA